MTSETVDVSLLMVSHGGPQFIGIEVDSRGNFGSRYSKRCVSQWQK